MSYEGLEQLLRFLFVLGITHVLYSGIAIGLAMSKVHILTPECYFFFSSQLLYSLLCTKSVVVMSADEQKTVKSESVFCFCRVTQIYSWRKWESQAIVMAEADLHGK